MPLDDRLRHELRRDADRIDPDVEVHLRAVRARVRRPALPNASLLVAAAVVIAVVVIVRTPATSGPGATPVPAGPTAAIAGTYSTVLSASDQGVAEHRLAGTWELRIGADGLAILTPPIGFQAGATSFPGIAISLTGDRLRTDALYTDYCGSVGTYRFVRSADHLTLEPVDDTCEIRVALLSASSWTATP